MNTIFFQGKIMHECEKTVDVKIKQRHVLSNRQVDSKCRQTEVSKELNCGVASDERYYKIIQFY